MCNDIERHAVQLHARNCRCHSINHFLALFVDVVEQFILLRVLEHVTQHSIQGGVFKLFRCKGVGRPI